jgi:RecQ mediated genome instability protein
MKRNSPAAVAEEVRLLLRYINQIIRVLLHLIESAFISNKLNSSCRRNGIAVCFEWVKQSIEYLSRKGLNLNNAESLSAKVYLLFLESDLHEISSGDGILPHNVHQIESGMLSSSNDILVLQVRGVSTFIE